jgi:polyferredoxin
MSTNNSVEKTTERNFKPLILIVGIFYTIAIVMFISSGSIFYLMNFTFIGTAAGLGLGLWPILAKKNRHKARKLSQTLIGGYMFLGLGCGLIYIFFGVIQPENMQFEGFWFWILGGMFAAGVLHYLIAKIAGPFLFNRGWCGWACWTAAILDYLPWKSSPGRIRKLGALRYLHFVIITAVIFTLVFVFSYTLSSTAGMIDLYGTFPLDIHEYDFIWQIPEIWWFLLGNTFYFISGIGLAIILKDNRAFCKYLCPIPVFMKIGSKYSILKIEGDSEKCTSCGACDRACPMDIKVSEYIKQGQRVTSSECIFCLNCVNACPNEVLTTSNKLDKHYNKYLQYKSEKEDRNNKK